MLIWSYRAAAAALMLGEEINNFARSPRLDRSEVAMDGMVNPVSRQIYLTFPADSTFKEEDVSNYFRYAFLNLIVVFFLQCYILRIVSD